MADTERFVVLNRSDGSKVAVQLDTILFFTKAQHGCVLNFGASTQVNIKEDFEELLAIVGDKGQSKDA